METLNRNIDDEIETGVKTGLNNRIDKEVQQIFRPLNLMQILLLNPIYHIRNNYINPNNCLNKFILISGAAMFLTLCTYRFMEILLDDNFRRYSIINFLLFGSIFDFIFKCLGFIMNFIINFTKSKKSVLIVLNLQDVHRLLKNEGSLKRFIMRSWISVCSIFGFYIFVVIYDNLVFFKPPWNVIFYLLTMATLDSTLIYLIRLIKLLTDKVVQWNIQFLLLRDYSCSKVESSRMFQAYDQILKCYKILTHIYQLPIVYNTTEAFCQSLININIVIEISQIEFKTKLQENPYISIFIFSWIIKNYALQISLSLQLEAFYEAVNCVQDSCEFILASNCTDDQKKLSKNILRVHRASFSRMSIFGLFYIDVCHPLRLLALLTHYVVILLQFALL